MGAPNRGLGHKRISISLTEDLDNAVLELRKQKEYCRYSYVECIRALIEEGAKAIASSHRDSDDKS